MEAHHNLIEKFYSSFQDHNAAGMIECYHQQVSFQDPGFGELEGIERVGGMWEMLLERSKGNLVIHYDSVMADEVGGYCHWEAHYPFSQTGRKVHNKIQATFRFEDGKIIEHHDHFNLWKWSHMALGIQGLLLGWTPFVQGKIRSMAVGQLDKYLSKKGS